MSIQTFFSKFDMMKVLEINTTIIDAYVGLLDNLSASNKLDLISKLTGLNPLVQAMPFRARL